MTGSDPRDPKDATSKPKDPLDPRLPPDSTTASGGRRPDTDEETRLGDDLDRDGYLDDESDIEGDTRADLNARAGSKAPLPKSVIDPELTGDPAAEREVPEDDDIDPSDYVDEAPSAPVAPPAATGAGAGAAAAHATPAPAAASAPPAKRGGRAALLLSVLALLGLAALAALGWMHEQRSSEALRAELEQRLESAQSEVRQAVNADLSATQSQVQEGLQTLRETRAQLDQELAAIRQAADPRPLLEPFEARVGRAESQVATATARVDDLASQQREAIEQMTQRLNGQQQRLLNLSTTNREDWLLAEAQYLLRLANQRVLIEREPSTAVALLQSADAVLEEAAAGLGDPELFAVRKAVTADIAALQLVAEPDRDGLYLRLQALADQAANLPTVPAHQLAAPGSEDEAAPAQPSISWWRRGWGEIKDLAGVFDQYIRVQDVDAPQQPLLDQATAQVAALNMRLLLEQAQVALLRQESTIYRESLSQAERLAQRYFLDGEAVQRYAAALAELAQMEIAPPLPDISQSVELLHTYIQLLHQSEGDA